MPTNPLPVPSTSARRRAGIATLAAMLLLAGLSPFLSSGTAGAVPRRCPISNPTCNVTRPTGPIIVVDPPSPPTWNVKLVDLVQNPYAGTVTADRFWLTSLVISNPGAAANRKVNVTVPVNLASLTPAGSVPLFSGGFFFPGMALPGNSTMALRLKESGNPGSLCRTKPVSPLPPSMTALHLLVAPPISESATDLNALVATFKGPQTGLGTGIEASITTANLKPTSAGLELRLQGTLSVTQGSPAVTWKFTFDDTLLLTLAPLNNTNTSQSLTVTVTPKSDALAWDGTPPANGTSILAFVKPIVASKLLGAVKSKAGPLVNTSVASQHDVRWWTEQGFTLSVRKVTYSSTDLKVFAALCRLGG